MTREEAEKHTILRAVVGSTCHGLNLEGSDDRDELGICVEPLSAVIGFSEFEQFIFRSAAEREGKHDAPSQAGDLDLTIYSLRKFLRLAIQGNPSVLLLLFTKDNVVERAPAGQLQDLAPYIVSRQAGKRFLGYLEAQRQRLMGERGQKKVHRPELEAKYGYDCYTEDTEFLTREGWKLYKDILDSEGVGTVNQETKSLEFQTPTERICKPYRGLAFELKHRYSNCMVTPNHRMWIKKKDIKKGPHTWRFEPASQIANHRSMQICATVNQTEKADYPIDDVLLKLIGAYVSEGSVAKYRKNGDPSVLSFSQHTDGRLIPILKDLSNRFKMKRYGPYPHHKKPKAVTYTLANRELAKRITSECGVGSHNKRLPKWIYDLSQRQAKVLLDSLCLGDGTKYPRTKHRVYYTIARRLAGDVQGLALVANMRSNMWGPFEKGMYQVLLAEGDPTQTIYKQRNIKRCKYTGNIVCFTVPNEVLITRRNGRVAVQGNTKYAMHILRLGHQGVELMETGKLTLPVPEPLRTHIRSVRTGEVPLNDVLEEAGNLEKKIKDLLNDSPLPENPNTKVVEDWMQEAYWHKWKATETQFQAAFMEDIRKAEEERKSLGYDTRRIG